MVWRTLRRFAGGRRYRRLIDVGGGEGYFASRWPEIDDKIVIDVNPAALATARARGLRVIAGDARRLPLQDGGADLVICSDVLEHLDPSEVGRALRELARACEPGGVTLLHTSCYGLYLRRWLRPAPQAAPLDRDDLKDGHRNRLTREALEGLIAEAGFTVRRRLYYKHLIHPLMEAAARAVRPPREAGAAAAAAAKREALSRPSVRFINNIRITAARLDPFLWGRIPGGAVIYRLEK